MSLMEHIANQNMRRDGTVPHWVKSLVRLGMIAIWALHDYLFAPLFGRGDGIL